MAVGLAGCPRCREVSVASLLWLAHKSLRCLGAAAHSRQGEGAEIRYCLRANDPASNDNVHGSRVNCGGVRSRAVFSAYVDWAWAGVAGLVCAGNASTERGRVTPRRLRWKCTGLASACRRIMNTLRRGAGLCVVPGFIRL